MKKLKTAKLVFAQFGFSGLFRVIKNKLQGKASLADFNLEHVKISKKKAKQNIVKEQYQENAPCVQNVLDIFKDQWACKIPIEGTTSGTTTLFDSETDPRIVDWNNLFPVKGKAILELGPLEGAHTYQLEQLGAESIIGIESGKTHFLKCLVVKDLLKLKAEFLYGDFRKYLKNCDKKFDIVLASGVLYHMTEPIELLSDMANVTDNIFLCTRYYSENRQDIAYRFENEPIILYNDYKGYVHYYDDPSNNELILGGTRHYSVWITKEDIINILNNLGFSNIIIINDNTDQDVGNNIILYASRSK